MLYQLRNLELGSTKRRYKTTKNSILTTFKLRSKIQEISTKDLRSRIKREELGL